MINIEVLKAWRHNFLTWEKRLKLQDEFGKKIAVKLKENIYILDAVISGAFEQDIFHLICHNNGFIVEHMLSKLLNFSGASDYSLEFISSKNNSFEKIHSKILDAYTLKFKDNTKGKRSLNRHNEGLKKIWDIRNQYSHASGMEGAKLNIDISLSIDSMITELKTFFEIVEYPPQLPDVTTMELPEENGNLFRWQLYPINDAEITLLSPASDTKEISFNQENNILSCSPSLLNKECIFLLSNIYKTVKKPIKIKREIILKPFESDKKKTALTWYFYHKLQSIPEAKFFTAENLPPGIKLNKKNGEIFGCFQKEGEFPVKIIAEDEDGDKGKQLTVNFFVSKKGLFSILARIRHNNALKKQYPNIKFE